MYWLSVEGQEFAFVGKEPVSAPNVRVRPFGNAIGVGLYLVVLAGVFWTHVGNSKGSSSCMQAPMKFLMPP